MTTEPEDQRLTTSAERLDFAILGEVPSLTAADVAEQTGVSLADAQRLWRALGFPEIASESAFTPADVQALKRLMSFVESGAVDLDMAVNLTRAMGQSMARLADWEVATWLARIDYLTRTQGSKVESALSLMSRLNAPFEELLLYAWRRHFAAAVGRIEAIGNAEGDNEEGSGDGDLHTIDVTVGFADLVSFTALSNEMGRDEIGDLVERFESRCHDVITRAGGRLIKSLGDSVLFVIASAPSAIAVAEGIINVIGRDPKMPDVRVGLASGPVIQRLGDVFGPPVNLAARLTDVARRNRLIIDQTTADRLPVDEFEPRRLPARDVRGFGLVEPVAVRRR